MMYILTALIAGAVGFAIAWSLAFDMGWDASRFAHSGDCARDQDTAFDRGVEHGRTEALNEVHFARSEAATRAAQTRAERKAKGALGWTPEEIATEARGGFLIVDDAEAA